MEPKKRNPWPFVLYVAMVAAVEFGPVFYYRWNITQPKLALVWIFLLAPFILLTQWGAHKLSRFIHEKLACHKERLKERIKQRNSN